jgi:hypothetical protein
MLMNFSRNGIDVSKLDPINRIIESAKGDQVKILNSYQPLTIQRVFFGVAINISTIAEVMKERIRVAREGHENPLTLDLSLELMDNFVALAPYIDEFIHYGKVRDIKRTNELSRLLYRKANTLGFYTTVETQLKSAGITKDEAKVFVEKLSENIGLEVETLDESV